ncbi:MAG: ISAs1 family transposase [Methylovulum sp.]|nr:ISAs1 family transposase [Methylovulum sp.]
MSSGILPNTSSDVLGRIDPDAFWKAFMLRVQVALPSLSGGQVCMDGKTLRGSRADDKAMHLVSAYAAKARWVLAQQAGGDKTNEITAIPDLLSILDIEGAVVSIGAMGCHLCPVGKKILPKRSLMPRPIMF